MNGPFSEEEGVRKAQEWQFRGSTRNGTLVDKNRPWSDETRRVRRIVEDARWELFMEVMAIARDVQKMNRDSYAAWKAFESFRDDATELIDVRKPRETNHAS